MSEAPEKECTHTFRNSYTLAIMFVSFVVLALGGYLYTNHVQQQSDHQWCRLLITITQPLPASPPPAPRQLTTYNLLKDLSRDKGCTNNDLRD